MQQKLLQNISSDQNEENLLQVPICNECIYNTILTLKAQRIQRKDKTIDSKSQWTKITTAQCLHIKIWLPKQGQHNEITKSHANLDGEILKDDC